LNYRIKLTIRKAYGFRTLEAAQIALYHTLGRLPEPELAHEFWCAVKSRASSVGAIPTRQLSLQPVAIGAAVEVTKQSKPSVQRVAIGDSASMQAVT
jgi:hypothetical protein